MADLDFSGLNERLLDDSRRWIQEWLPGGNFSGHEYVCGGIAGGKGRSFSVNQNNGKWAEFNGLAGKGGDLISLYAYLFCNQNQGDAFKALVKLVGFESSGSSAPAAKAESAVPESKITPPPADAPPPRMAGVAKAWCYKDQAGAVLFWVLRFESENGKEIRPASWDSTTSKWIFKGFPEPRPLYGLELLAGSPDKPIMLVEGEKSADAAQKIVGDRYIVMTWPNGALAVGKADWKPIFGRKVLIWGDADLKKYPELLATKDPHPKAGQLVPHEDQPGYVAATSIARVLAPHCPEVKVLNPHRDPERKDGWDAADALAEGWDWEKLKAFAKPQLQTISAPPAPKAEMILDVAPPQEYEESKPAAKARAAAAAKSGKRSVGAAASVEVNIDDGEAEGQKKTFGKIWADLGLAATKQGAVANIDNVLRVLENREEFKDMVWFDDFHQKYFTAMNFMTWEVEDKAREWRDIDNLYLTAFIQRHLGMTKVYDSMVDQAVRIHAHSHVRNEPREWVQGLKWDGVERIEAFLGAAFGCEATDYVFAASKNWWISIVARILNPGCKVDHMLILEGLQGSFKSMAFSIIGGDWATEARESLMSKDFFVTIQGKILVVINELDAFRKSEVTTIKNVVTTAVDRYREPYGRTAVDHPRQCVFVGTTNKENYLNDNSGGRRFIPIKAKRVDIKLIKEIREQCFAEAAHRFMAGATWWEMPVKETADEQEKRRIADEWEGEIAEYISSFNEITIRQIAQDCIKLSLIDLGRREQDRIGECLRFLGWECQTAWRDGRTLKIYSKRQA